MKKSTSTIIYLTLCVASCCLGMQPQYHSDRSIEREDPDKLRKQVLTNTVLQKLKNITTLATKIRAIIADGYRSIPILTISEQQTLLHNWPSIKTELEDRPYTSEVFYEKFTDFVNQKNNSSTSKTEPTSSTKNQSVSMNELPTLPPEASTSYKILKATDYSTAIIMDTPEIFQQEFQQITALEPLSRNSTEPQSLILPTEEIPFIFDEDEESGYFFPERLF